MGGAYGGSRRIHPFFDLHLGELHDQDSILGHQSDEHDQPDLEIDVVLQSAGPDTQVGAHDGHRQREHHGDGDVPAFVLGGQEEKDEQEHECQHIARLSAGPLLLVGEPAPFDPDVLGQVLLGELLHVGHHLPGAVSRCGDALNGRGVEHVETLDVA